MAQQNRRTNGTLPNQQVNRTNSITHTHVQRAATNPTNNYSEKTSTSLQSITKQDQWSKADKISAGMLGVTILLMIFTGGLYYSATKDSKTASNAATIADSTFKATKRYNDSSLKIQERVFKSNDSNSKKSLKAQIASLKETQKDFGITNEPYLEITKAYIDTFVVGKFVYVNYIINNLGNYPVKIIGSKAYTAVRKTDPFKESSNKQSAFNNLRIINQYVIKENEMGYSDISPMILTQGNYNAITKYGYFFWFFGNIEYINLITKKKKEYRFSIKMVPNKIGATTYGDNTSINN